MERKPAYWILNTSTLYQTVETVTIPPGLWPVYERAAHIKAAIVKQGWAELVGPPVGWKDTTTTGPTDTTSTIPVEEMVVESIGPPVEDPPQKESEVDEAAKAQDTEPPPQKKRKRRARRIGERSR